MDEKTAFSWEAFGAALKSARKEAGYSSADSFSEAVYSASGLTISKVTIYKIEKGLKQPTAAEVMAFSLTLYGATDAFAMHDLLNGCICDEWKSKNREHHLQERDRLLAEAASHGAAMSTERMKLQMAEKECEATIALAYKKFEAVASDGNSTIAELEAAHAASTEQMQRAITKLKDAIHAADALLTD